MLNLKKISHLFESATEYTTDTLNEKRKEPLSAHKLFLKISIIFYHITSPLRHKVLEDFMLEYFYINNLSVVYVILFHITKESITTFKADDIKLGL